MEISHARHWSHIAFIRGYYGYSNIGDEAMLNVLISYLTKNRIVSIVASKDTAYTERIHKVRAVYSGANWNFLRAFLFSNVLIEGPGNKHGFLSIIDSGLPVLARILGKSVWYVGLGFNPHVWKDSPTINQSQEVRYNSIIKRVILCAVFNIFVDSILVRDRLSKKFLNLNGVADKKIMVTKDLAYFLDSAPKEEIARLLFSFGINLGKDKLVGISVRKFADCKINKYFGEKIEEIMVRIYHKVPEVKFIFLPFSKRGYDNDVKYSIEIKDVVKNVIPPDKMVIADLDDPKAIKGIICVCSLVIGVRYHSHVFASSCKVPFVAIIYDPKSREPAAKALANFNINKIFVDKVLEGAIPNLERVE
jgi:polysaccharide pyruvyl transferase WcaK-like protein